MVNRVWQLSLTMEFVNRVCQWSLSIQFVYRVYPQSLSTELATQFVRSVWPKVCQVSLSTLSKKIRLTCKIMSRQLLGWDSNISKLCQPKPFWHIGVLMAFLVNVNTVCQWNSPTHLSKIFVKYFINSNCIFSTIFEKICFSMLFVNKD